MAIIVPLAATVLAGCGSGGSKAAPTPAPTAVATISSYTSAALTADQLGAMTLPLAEFGPRYAIFVPVVNGPLTAILERAIDACDPNNESQALSKYEWERGYSHQYGAMEGDTSGDISIGTDIDIYSSAENAAGKLKYDKVALENDSRAGWGCQGAKIERIDEFAAEGIGDESWGVRIRFSLDGIRGTTTAIVFRRHRVLGTVSITRVNSEDSTTEIVDAAKKVDEKMMDVLTAPLT
jgi:hypothetical protein